MANDVNAMSTQQCNHLSCHDRCSFWQVPIPIVSVTFVSTDRGDKNLYTSRALWHIHTWTEQHVIKFLGARASLGGYPVTVFEYNAQFLSKRLPSLLVSRGFGVCVFWTCLLVTQTSGSARPAGAHVHQRPK